MNTLVVEDDAAVREVVVAITEMSLPGRSVTTAGCGRDALALAESAHPEVLVLDLGLPDMHGLDVLARLRERGFDGQVVIATAEDTPTNRRRAAELGVSAFLVKPFEARELRKALVTAAMGAERSSVSVVA